MLLELPGWHPLQAQGRRPVSLQSCNFRQCVVDDFCGSTLEEVPALEALKARSQSLYCNAGVHIPLGVGHPMPSQSRFVRRDRNWVATWQEADSRTALRCSTPQLHQNPYSLSDSRLHRLPSVAVFIVRSE